MEPTTHFKSLSDLIEGEAEFVPLLSQEDEERINAEEIPNSLPILPLRNTVLFPGVVIPLTIGRDKSINLIREAYQGDKTIGVVAQRDAKIENPKVEDLHDVGTVAHILKLLHMPDGSNTAIIQGKKRFQIEEMVQEKPYFTARVTEYDPDLEVEKDDKFFALIDSIKELSTQIIKQSPNIPSEANVAIKNIESHIFLINFVASNLNTEIFEKQKLLEISDITERANLVLSLLSKELQMLELKNQIQDKVKTDIDKQQRDYLLNQQLKTIKEELGEGPAQQETEELKTKAKKKKWGKEIKETFVKELTKLERMNPAAVEYSIQMNYLNVLVDLPWGEYTEDSFDIRKAEEILDQDHYGLEKIKERIIEYLAVLKLKGDMRSPILCLLGPPGVGKTSLGKSVAKSIGRNYIRMSLGGIRDEAEIRGHRKTYIGAMPGRIIQSLRRAKSANPVFVLDEIDKVIGGNISGDPASALLEVLDPEQNRSFYDNFLETEFDLSKVMFIATANTLNTVHPALRDRMEVIDISGYLVEEKIEIACRHLLPKQLREHGVKQNQLSFTKKLLDKLIDDYTRESGVRTLDKLLAKIIRNKAKYIVMNESYTKKVTEEDLYQILGPLRYQQERDTSHIVPGVSVGLAWTAVGGEILFVEASLSQGKGNLTMTGNLGDVMKESATIAFEYLKAHSGILDIDPDVFTKWNVHIHIPEGATPKDGPSAGITILSALASLFTQRKVKAKLAMTGEITLRGKVLPVGGVKEKILAARRAKVKDIIMSEDNKKDLEEIKPEYLHGLRFHYVNQMIEVIDLALTIDKVKGSLRVEK